MDRREFLKKAFQIGGIAALYNLGVTLEQAQAWGVLPAVVGGDTGGPEWANWNESSEDTLAVDQDGDGVEDTFICFMENPAAGGDETGRGGGLAGGNLVISQSGNVAGAVGSPPYRTVDATINQFFNPANAIADVSAVGGSTFTIIIKAGNVGATTGGAGTNKYLLHIIDGAGKQWSFYGGTARIHKALINGVVSNIPAAAPDNEICWFAIACDGVNNTWAGWSTARPLAKADFNSTVTSGAVSCLQAGATVFYLNAASGTGTNRNGGNMFYTLVSGVYLF